MFPIIEVPNDAVQKLEQLGTKAKFWFQDADGRLTLCKTGRKNTGEDWAEKLAAELAEALGLPHAEYELAVWRGEPCVVSRSIVPEGSTLITGNEALTAHDWIYTLEGSRFKQSTHTLEAIWEVLAPGRCELPLKWHPPSPDCTARDVFTGYLMLDTLIGNTDRHDENWALIELPETDQFRRHLAPTYDHASSLGCHESDENRRERLVTRDAGRSVQHYAERCKSALYASPKHTKPLSNLDAVARACEKGGFIRWWISKLESVDADRIDILLSRVPKDRMSSDAAEFARRMLLHNRTRILALRLQK